MSIRRAIKSVSLLWMGSLLGSGSTFIIYMILARELGVEQFGLFSSAFSMVTILSILAGFGVAQSWLKHFGKEGWQATRWLPSSFRLVSFYIVFVLVILFIWAYFGPHDDVTKEILYIFSVFIIGQMVIELVSVKLQLEEKYFTLAFWQLLPNFSRLVFVASFIYLFSISLEVTQLAYIYTGIALVFIIIGIYQLHHMNQNNFDLKGHGERKNAEVIIPNTKETFSHSWAFGLAGVFAFIYLQSDIIMVKYMVGNSEAGYYNAAFVIITAILMFPAVLYSKFLLPKYHRWANHDKAKFYEVYQKGNIAMLISGIIIMFCVLFLSNFFIPIIFGDGYENTIILLKILSLTLPFYFVAYSVGATLVTNEHMKLKIKLMGFVAFVNIVLNILLIPKYAASGAAIATLLSNILLLLLYYRVAQQNVFNIKGNENVAIS